jgi:hypothetical protein
LLIPLPGVVFSIVFYVVLLILEKRFVPVEKRWPANYREWSHHYFGTTFWCVGIAGGVALILCVVVAVILTRARQPGIKIPREELAAKAFYLFLLNAVISFGGALAADHLGRVHEQPVTAAPQMPEKKEVTHRGSIVTQFIMDSQKRRTPG